MKQILAGVIFAVFNGAYTVAMELPNASLASVLHQITTNTEQKIQTEIVDPILGKGNAFVFADIELEIVAKSAVQTKEGLGQMSKSNSISTESVTHLSDGIAGNEEDVFKGFDFGGPPDPAPKPQAVLKKEQNPEGVAQAAVLPEMGQLSRRGQSQVAQQGKGVAEQRLGAYFENKRFSLSILHESTISKEKLEIVRKAILSLYPRAVNGQSDMVISFLPAPFVKNEKKEGWLRKVIK